MDFIAEGIQFYIQLDWKWWEDTGNLIENFFTWRHFYNQC